MGRLSNRFQLDWFNVTYRSVLLGVALVVGLLGGGGSYWYYRYVHLPRASASEALGRAEQRIGEAAALQATDPRVDEVVASARAALGDARELFAGLRFDDARGAALRSENLSLQALGMVKGTESGTGMVRFYRLEGDVRVKRTGEFSWSAANARMELRLGDQVKTSSSGSAQLIYFDGTITVIEPGSLLEIRELFENPATKVRRVREQLSFGELRASTAGKNVNGSVHEVATGSVVASSDEPAEFRVRAPEGGAERSFDVFQGRVAVSGKQRNESLVAGERIRAFDDGRFSAKEALPGVPLPLTPRDQKVFVFDGAEGAPAVTLAWEGVAGAARYRLVISDKALFTTPLYDAERSGTSAVIEEVPEGAFHWKVAAISAQGASGEFSGPRRFRVSSQRLRDRSDSVPPELAISEFVSVGAMVIVNGRTEPGASLWVDNERVDVYDDGTFYAVVRLRKEGLNNLRFVAQDTAGNETELRRSTYLEIF